MRNRIIFFLLGLLFFLPNESFAWWGSGHVVTAMVAWDHMTPNARTRATELVKIIDQLYPERDYDFATIGLWADDIKTHDIRAFSAWHYTNIPLNQTQQDNVGEQPEVNVVWAIDESISVLRSRKSNDFEKALFLAFLVHFVGDIHQPLHVSSLYSDKHPEGTRGGNEYNIADDNHNNNLHALWDDGCGLFPKLGMYEDVGPELRKALQKVATDCASAHPMQNQLLLGRRPGAEYWARESFNYTADAYKALPEGKKPGVSYIIDCKRIVKERIALGGYRLATVLNDIFKE